MRLKDFINGSFHRIIKQIYRFWLWIQFRSNFVTQYQPNPFNDCEVRIAFQGRSCIDRFNSVYREISKEHASVNSVLDIGCNIGYFVFKMAENNTFGIGLDIGRNEIMTANSLAYVNGVTNVSFSQFKVTPTTAKNLPKVDMIFCLSIFHHWVKNYGFEGAAEIMRILSEKTNCIIFETGQSDEVNKSWSVLLTFMEPDPRKWIESFLDDLGFKQIKCLGEYDTSVSDVPRYLFMAQKK